MTVPKYADLFSPLLTVVHKLGSSASIAEQEDEVASMLQLTEEEISEIHRGNRTKLSYRLAWARNYLKRFGLLTNSERGVRTLSSAGQDTLEVNKDAVKKFVQSLDHREKVQNDEQENGTEFEETNWQDELLSIIKVISPKAFERLCQRKLRESGFTHVEMT